MKNAAPRRVMHVDDDVQFARIVRRKLETAGIEVQSVHDPEQVLDELLLSDCRVVILDIDMPSTTGMELLQQIKQQDGGVQVVMLTGIVTMSTVLQSMRCGAEACVFKPIHDADRLLTAVKACFEKIDRWWQALQELKERKLAETSAIAAATTN